MEFEVDGWNNIHRVFELPEKFSGEFCFGGGIPTNIQMVDWFNTFCDLPQPAVPKKVWIKKFGSIDVKKVTLQEIYDNLIECLKSKQYVKPNRKYLVICGCGACFVFGKDV